MDAYLSRPSKAAFPKMDPYELTLMLTRTLSSSTFALAKTLEGIEKRLEELPDAGEAISLSAEEHKALCRYLGLKNQMENIEWKQIYFRGHTDSFAYLKKIGVI